jgi:hypothetical protein
LEPTEFDPKWFSHKFRGPGVRYEIGLCIATGNIVWAHGGYRCGQWPDSRLAREAFIARSSGDPLKKILARHETVNKRVKQFYCMKDVFRHVLTLHPSFFRDCVNLTQIMIVNGEPLHDVEPLVQ